MQKFFCLAVLLLLSVSSHLAQAAETDELKAAVIASVDEQYEPLIQASDAVWSFAETALHESHSAELLANYAEEQGFRVQRAVAGMPTAFIANYGEGRPIIGVMGEYDALPRLSQAAEPQRNALVADAPGHGCGHNLYGVASLGAAIAIKQLIDDGKLQGTLRYYGTPAEESVGGKTYMARDGFFDDLDVALAWHPGDETKVDITGGQAMVETSVEFTGSTSHAAFDPWNGRSALDGLELFTHSLNLLREHVQPSVRIHYSYVDGGGAPNVVPATASAAVWIRDSEIGNVMRLFERMKTMAAGAAMAANVEADVRLIAGTYNALNNKEAAKVVHANMRKLGPIQYDDAESTFARELQEAMGVSIEGIDGAVQELDLDATEVTGGSTDVADVSWIVPTIDFNVVTAPTDIPWHSWGVVASSGMSIGHRGMRYAAKVLGMTMVDLFTSPETIKAIQAEFDEVSSGFEYHAYLPEGPPPIPQN